ncbi:MAG: hypothetical protein HUU22_05440 [Phycisphaerae bacterium]|nr:hypothetical protein [Phycisphaerae bacterium]NUQ45457.1 hypothetical protein [Phycisphaerae bacterium]
MDVQIETLQAVRERPAVLCYEARMIVGHAAAAGKPAAVEPLHRAEFESDSAADFDLRDRHRLKPEPADLALLREQQALEPQRLAEVA